MEFIVTIIITFAIIYFIVKSVKKNKKIVKDKLDFLAEKFGNRISNSVKVAENPKISLEFLQSNYELLEDIDNEDARLILYVKLLSDSNSKTKFMKLKNKYDLDKLIRAMNNQIEIDDTMDFVKDALGNPDKEDNTIMKTKTKDVWKYTKQGNTWRYSFTFENGLVTKIDDKS